MDNPFKSPVVLSLCPGILGLERGCTKALGSELRVAAYSEIETFIDANLIAGMEAGILAPAPIWSDIKTFPFRQFHRKIHGIIGGYPCQPFSNAGKRKGEEDPRHLWPFIREGIWAVEPFWCFFENVAGHLTLGYETVRSELQGLGYIVKEGIFSSEEVGAPHQRKRLFILAIKQGVVLDNAYCSSAGNEIQTRRNAIELASQVGVGQAHSDRIRYLLRESGIITAEGEFNALSDASTSGEQGMDTTRGVAQVNSSRGRSGGLQDPTGEREGYGITRTSGILSGAGVGLADTCGTGQQGSEWSRTFCNERTTTRGSITECRKDKRPARPGQQQYEWEATRTISKETEPDLGLSINGYNYREDLLRAIGNSVDEWVAEKAFITLLNKHLK